MDSSTNQTISTDANPIKEKIKNKLKEYAEFKYLYNISNEELKISLICL